MFMQDTTTEFQNLIDEAYKDTSLHLLDVLHEKYKFLDHLKVCIHHFYYVILKIKMKSQWRAVVVVIVW
jgi:hypothetical protein